MVSSILGCRCVAPENVCTHRPSRRVGGGGVKNKQTHNFQDGGVQTK